MAELQGAFIHITGIVQGVGFRPFVYGLAKRLNLTGWVRNTSAGVDIEVNGEATSIQSFIASLNNETPPLARIDEIKINPRPLKYFHIFEIIQSESIPEAFQPLSPDVSICPDCLSELFNTQDRRYRYPFINCTNCGPRLTIIKDIPYDRPYTTMAPFQMCTRCEVEYNDPMNRRFHAQPIACSECGPQVWFESSVQNPSLNNNFKLVGDAAIQETQKLLTRGNIIAIKGLGGFHLACNATDTKAVVELRKRKLRVDKPFALMAPDISTVAEHCLLDAAEKDLLESRERPIVILKRRTESPIAYEVAPGQNTLGMMLPYTPLHYLLFSKPLESNKHFLSPSVLVMTSGNLCEEPVATDNDETRLRLSGLADGFLMHDRMIYTRCDDSVVRIFSNKKSPSIPPHVYPIRRSRGYSPFPVHLAWDVPPILATGAELKNTFCIAKGSYAILSHHIGDMENFETYKSFEESVIHYEKLFRIQPLVLVRDLHPNYLTTRYAFERAERENLPTIAVQHHHAHIAACMAENQLNENNSVIGISFDGTGYGGDGAIWGGEIFIANYNIYKRIYHLAYVPLPGGDSSIRKPARIALAHLWAANLDWEAWLPPVTSLSAEERSVLRSQLTHRINAPSTSSMGRLFDAAAALIGIRQIINYEAQAAIEFEMIVDREENTAYSFDIIGLDARGGSDGEDNSGIIDPSPVLRSIVADLKADLPLPKISARFHNGISHMIRDVCKNLREQNSINEVVLSGGVWQNMTLLRSTVIMLKRENFKVYWHRLVPPNDGGLALGQAVIGFHQMTNSNNSITHERFIGPIKRFKEKR